MTFDQILLGVFIVFFIGLCIIVYFGGNDV